MGVISLLLGYALSYTGVANLLNGGAGPKLWQSLGFPGPITPPGGQVFTGTGDDGGIVDVAPDTGIFPKISVPGASWDPGIDWSTGLPLPRLPEIEPPGWPF